MREAKFVPIKQVMDWRIVRRRFATLHEIASYDFLFLCHLRVAGYSWPEIGEAVGGKSCATRMWFRRSVAGREVEPVVRVARGLVMLGVCK